MEYTFFQRPINIYSQAPSNDGTVIDEPFEAADLQHRRDNQCEQFKASQPQQSILVEFSLLFESHVPLISDFFYLNLAGRGTLNDSAIAARLPAVGSICSLLIGVIRCFMNSTLAIT